MSANARFVAAILGAVLAISGLVLIVFADGAGWGLLILAALLFASLLFEKRYNRECELEADSAVQWQRTGERFIDDESGRAMEVWMDPLTGQRRYEPIAGRTRLRRP